MNEITIQALAHRDATDAVVIADPFDPAKFHHSASEIVASLNARLNADCKAVDDLGDLDDAPLAAVTAARKALEADDKAMLEYSKTMADALLDYYGLKAVIVQMQGPKSRIDPLSVRGKIRDRIALLKQREDADRPAEPVRNRVVILACNDSAWKTISGSIGRAGVKCGEYAELTKPDHIERVRKVIKAVRDEAEKAAEKMEG